MSPLAARPVTLLWKHSELGTCLMGVCSYGQAESASKAKVCKLQGVAFPVYEEVLGLQVSVQNPAQQAPHSCVCTKVVMQDHHQMEMPGLLFLALQTSESTGSSMNTWLSPDECGVWEVCTCERGSM